MNGQDGNGEDVDKDNKKKYRSTKIDFENENGEKRDTEDSYELEITPKQLSQVTPGGGVLKIKLSKKRPVKITTEIPNKRPDLAHTEF